MQLACRPSRWLAGTRPGIGETFGSPPRYWGAVVSEVVRMRVSSCDPATRPIRPRPSYRTLNQHHLKRNRKFVDSPLEEDEFELLVRGRGEAGCRPFLAPGCVDEPARSERGTAVPRVCPASC